MDDSLKRILEVNRTADQKVKEAEEYRKVQISSLSAKKEEIIEKETQRARDSAAKRSKKAEAECRERLETVKKNNAMIKDRLQSEFQNNRSRWIDEITENVLSIGR